MLSRDLDQTAASVDAFAAGDGEAWRRWVSLWREVEQPVLAALLRPFPPVRPALSIARRLGAPRRAAGPHRGAAGPPVRPRGVPRRGAAMLVAGNVMHTDLGPESAGSALYGLLLAMLGQQHGFPVPEGGSGRLTDALVSRLQARGGVLRCSAPGDLGGPGRPAGVEGVGLASGERVRAIGRCWPTYRRRALPVDGRGAPICRPGCASTSTGSSGTTPP